MKNIQSLLKGALVGAVLSCSATSVHAIVVTNDEATYMGQIDQSLTIDIALDQNGAPHPLALTQVSGADFTSNPFDSNFSSPLADDPSQVVIAISGIPEVGPIEGTTNFDGDLRLDLGGFATALGFSFFQAGGTMNLLGAGDVVLETVAYGSGFTGFFDALPFQAILFDTDVGFWSLNGGPNNRNTIFGQVAATAVPEPSTLALLGFGLAGLGVAVRRRRSH